MSYRGKVILVGAATLASRLGGFLRDSLLAALLGATPAADAVFAALLLPNLFRRMLSEGAVNAAFVPIFSRREAQEGRASAERWFMGVLRAFALVVLPLVVLAILFQPVLTGLIVGGYRQEPATFSETVRLSRLAMPYIAAITFAALLSAFLNATGRFRAAAFAPVLFNLLLAGALILLLADGAGRGPVGEIVVALVSVAGLLQAGLLAFMVWQRGQGPSGAALLGRPRDADVRRFAWRLIPGLVLASAGHINLLAAVSLASVLPASVSWLYYADRLFQLPLGMVASALGIVVLPDVARHVNSGDNPAAAASISRSLEFALALTVPAALALAGLAMPIIDILYRHGAFTPADTAATAAMLRPLACALPAFVLVKVALPHFMARERFALPLLAVGAGLVVNIATGTALRPEIGVSAPAWGVAASAWLNALLLWLPLLAGRSRALDQHAAGRLLRVALACVASAAVIALLALLLTRPALAEAAFIWRLAALGAACMAGIAAQAVALWLLGIVTSRDLRRPAAAGGISTGADTG